MDDIAASLPSPIGPTSVPQDEHLDTPPVSRAQPRPRVWPAVILILIQWAVILLPPWVSDNPMLAFMGLFWGPVVGVLTIALWWVVASRLGWADRILFPLLFAASAGGAYLLCHKSFMFMAMLIFALPYATTAWVVWMVLTSFLSWPVRRAGLAMVILLSWAWCPLVRFDGIFGNLETQFTWRWAETAEDRARQERSTGSEKLLVDAKAVQAKPGDWIAFRGPERNSELKGVKIGTDWTKHPPKLLWKHRVGPGWSSFVVVGNRLFTQEQRDDVESVVCYDTETGKEVWAHDDATRFTEAVAGPGPRATPTFHEGSLFTLGANGTLNRLDAATGKSIWKRDIAEDAGIPKDKHPTWGYSSSPLVAEGVVIVYATGNGTTGGDGHLLGYHPDTGEPAWNVTKGGHSYCSAQLSKLDGVEQCLLSLDAGLVSFAPKDGKILWEAAWPIPTGMYRAVQPAVVGKNEVLLGAGANVGTRKFHVAKTDTGWQAEEKWTTTAIKPNYNDLVVYQGHLYGFDNDFFTCVSLEDGTSKWRARGYGNGQVLLLADQGLLLILAEKGAVALVEAKPEGHKQIGKFQAINGKTWNHPVVAHGKLFVRNGEEMACFAVGE
jgi:outer membrane protein assembly factor BamB